VYGNSIDEDCSGADLVLSGTVYDELGQELCNANVTATCGADVYSSKTDCMAAAQTARAPSIGEGNYQLNINTPTPCDVVASKEGFVTSNAYNPSTDLGVENVDFTLDQDDAIAGGISGEVYQTGPITALPGIKLSAVDTSTDEVIQVVYSNGTAEYEFAGLPAGTYDIEAESGAHNYPSADPFFPPAYNIVVAAGVQNPNNFVWMDVGGAD